MSLSDIFDSIGGALSRGGQNFSDNISNAPPESWFALSQALSSAPRGQFGAGLAQGLAGFSQASMAEQKKKGLADALQSYLPNVPEAQRPLIQAWAQNDPEGALSALAGQAFKPKPQAPDLQQNYEYAQRNGFKGTFTDFVQMGKMQPDYTINIPGLGPVSHRTGQPVGSPGQPPPIATDPNAPIPDVGAPGGQPVPAGTDTSGAPNGSPALDPSMAPPPASVGAVPPNNQGVAPKWIPYAGPQLKLLGKTNTGGGEWGVTFDASKPQGQQYSQPTFKPAAGGLTDEAMNTAFEQLLAGDDSGIKGYGRSPGTRLQLGNALPAFLAKKGLKPADIAAAKAGYLGDTAGLKALGARKANIDTAAMEANNFAVQALSASDTIPRRKWVPLNQLIQGVNVMTSDPKLAYFAQKNIDLAAALAVTLGRGTTNQFLQEEMMKRVTTATSPEAYKSQLKAVLENTHGVVASTQAVRQQMIDTIKGIGEGGPSNASKPDPFGIR